MQLFQKDKSILLFVIIILLANVLLYAKSINYDFVGYDDSGYIIRNEYIRNMNKENVKYIFTNPYYTNYQPLVHLSYAIDYKFSELNAKSYHISNVLFHIANSILIFFLIFMITKNGWAAFIVAIFFSIHPIQVESVAWVSERKGLMSTFFSILSFIYYIRFSDCAKKRYYILSIIMFILALLSKPMAVTLPIVFILYDRYIKGKGIINVNTLVNKVPYLLLALVSGIITIYAQEGSSINKALINSPLFNIFFALYSIGFYIGKLLLPMQQSVYYGYPSASSSLLIEYIIAGITAISLLIYLIKLNKFDGMINFCLLFFLISLIPILRILPIGDTFAADRYMYFPMVGFFTAIVIWFINYLKNRPSLKRAVSILAVIYILSLSVVSYARLSVWSDGITLWSDVAKKYPDSGRAHHNIGVYLSESGDTKAAMAHYLRVIERGERTSIKGKEIVSMSYINLGGIYAQIAEAELALGKKRQAQQNYIKAIELTGKAIELDATNARPYHNLGIYYNKLNNNKKAEENYLRAIELDPDYASPYINLGEIHYNIGGYDKALSYFKKAIELDPQNSVAYNCMGVAYSATGNYEEALKCLDMALEYSPDDVNIQKNMNILKEVMQSGSSEQ